MHCYDDSDSDCECDYSSERLDANPTIPGVYSSLDVNSMHTDSVFPRPELKFMDYDQAGTTPPNAVTPTNITGGAGIGTVLCLNTMIQGSTSGTAVGNQITVKRISYRYGLNLSATPTYVRVSLVWDKQSNGALPAYADIFDDASQPLVNRNLIFSHLNIDNRRRFVVLKDENYPLTINSSQFYNMSGVVPIDMKSTYVNSTVSRQIPQTGALLLCLSSFAATGTQIIGRWRVRYYDN